MKPDDRLRLYKEKLASARYDNVVTKEAAAWLIKRVEELTEALESVGVCTCDARFSGNDEAEYRARGCPSCSCEPDWMIAKKALERE